MRRPSSVFRRSSIRRRTGWRRSGSLDAVRTRSSSRVSPPSPMPQGKAPSPFPAPSAHSITASSPPSNARRNRRNFSGLSSRVRSIWCIRSSGIPVAGSRRVMRMSSTPLTLTLNRKAMNAVRRATGSLQRKGSGSRRAWSSATETGQAATSTSSTGRATLPSMVNVRSSSAAAHTTRRPASTRASRAASRRARASVTRGSSASCSTLR